VTLDRSYPKDLAVRVKASWPADALPLPDRLEALLGVTYHASFLRDEERLVTFRMMVMRPSELQDDWGPPAGLLPLEFATNRTFDEQELRRLSPAADVHRALIGVCETNAGLTIWGIVQSGPRWLQAAQGGRAKDPPMPRCLVVRAVRPGHLVVSCGTQMIAELRGGALSDFALDVFQSAWLPAQFAEVRARVAAEHREASPQTMMSDDASMQLTGHLAQQMIKRVIATMRGSHHGGTLLIVPTQCAPDRYLQTTYAFEHALPHRRFRTLSLKILETVAARAIATGQPPGVELYRRDRDAKLAELDEGLFEVSHLIAALTHVDGAVLLTKRWELLGFGAEIAGNLPVVHEVRRGLDLEADRFSIEVVDSVGTRHRSAYRFCTAVDGAIAVVVSQDGGVRFVNLHRGALTYWDHGPGDG
jgi:hypothetical protein